MSQYLRILEALTISPPSGFTSVRWDRRSRVGGVALIIKSITYHQVQVPSDYSHIEIVCVVSRIGSQNHRFIGYYPSGGFDLAAGQYATDIINCLRHLCLGDHKLCLMGDFNLPELPQLGIHIGS